MIRFDEVRKIIIIARVAFYNERKGHLTRLIQSLIGYGVFNNYRGLEIESCNAKSAKYARKHNFFKR